MLRLNIFLFAVFISFSSYSDDYVFVTAERVDSSSWSTAHSTSQKEIKESSFLGDLLNDLPGVLVTGNGNPRATSNIFIRGSQSHHTLVLIDGLELYDPSIAKRTFDAGNTSLGGIERVEVLRGGQSVLFGSNAVGGVVQLLSSDSSKEEKKISAGYGNAKEHLLRYKQQGKIKNWQYVAMLEKKGDEGISDINDPTRPNDRDGFNLFTFHGKIKGELTPNQNLEFVSRYQYSKKDNDGDSGADDPDAYAKVKEAYFRLAHNYFFENLPLELQSSLAYATHRRDYFAKDFNSHYLTTKYEGDVTKLSLQGNYFWTKKRASSLGLEGKREEDHSKAVTPVKNKIETKSLWANHHEEFSSFFVSMGGRLEKDDLSSDRFTYRLAPGYKLPWGSWVLKGATSTSYIAPTLGMLYDRNYGNENLKAEKSSQWEFGLGQEFLNLTYFETRIKDRFSFQSGTNKNINAGKARIKGVEAETHTPRFSHFLLKLSGTRLYTLDLATGRELQRRPRFMGHIGLDYEFESLKSLLDFQYVGARDDLDARTWANKRMPSYVLMNLNTSFKDHSREYWAKLTNLLDKDYQEFDSYNTPGRSLMLGLDWAF